MNIPSIILKLLSTIFSVWIAFPSEVFAINCYQCQSNKDLECSEKFDHEFTKLKPEPCDHVFEAQYCIKSTGMFEGQIGTQRFCSSRDFGDYCDYVKRPGDERDYRSCIFTCSSDDCNDSHPILVSNIILISLIFVTILYLNLNF